MKVLITGSNGQLGSELKDVLTRSPILETYFLDRKQLPLDMPLLIQDILGMYEPHIIIHAGAYTAVDKAELEPELANVVNHLATEEIAQYCFNTGAKLIFVSTDYVFDGTSESPLSEDAAVSPINTYGITKLNGEKAVQKWCKDAVIIRTSWVYSRYGENFVKTMLRLMGEKPEISVVNDQIGSPTYAFDLANTISTILMHKDWYPGIYNYSHEGRISWFDFACAIRDIRKLACEIHPIPTSAFPTAAKRPQFSLLDKSKIKSRYEVEVPQWRERLEVMLSRYENPISEFEK